MVLNGKKRMFFNNAYSGYLDLMQALKEIYTDANGDIRYSDDMPMFGTVKNQMKLYLLTKLLEISCSDKSATDEECSFISSLISEPDILKNRIAGYNQFLSNPNTFTMESIKNNNQFNFEDIPMGLDVAVLEDSYVLSNFTDIILKSLDSIFKNFCDIDDINKTESIKKYRLEMSRLRKHVSQKKKEECLDEDNPEESIDELIEQLNSLVGLNKVKEVINEQIALVKFNNLFKENGEEEFRTSKHLVFQGNPGTGKTTIARLLAKIYKNLGVVSKGQFVETDRAGLVAEYIGQTATKTTRVVEKALGGILFIDEAYSLTRSSSDNDFGKEAIDTLCALMENHRDDLVVVVAGYTDKMHEFIDANEGLSSRFTTYVDFEDYTFDELVDIFKGICKSKKIILADDVVSKLYNLLKTSNINMVTFGNARGIRNIFEKALTNMAKRVVKLSAEKGSLTDEELHTLTVDDLPAQIS